MAPLLLSCDRTWMSETRYLTLRDYYEHWNEDRELNYLNMVKSGRGRIFVNDKDLMDSITRGIFEDDEELGLCHASIGRKLKINKTFYQRKSLQLLV